MSNLKVLQKLTLGKEDTITIPVEFPSGTEEITLRPLTDGELTKLQGLEKKPYNMKIKVNKNGERESVSREYQPNTDVDVGMGDFTKYQMKAMYTAIAWSLSIDETVTVEDIENLPPGVPDILFEKVIEISKLKDDDLTAIKQFRNK